MVALLEKLLNYYNKKSIVNKYFKQLSILCLLWIIALMIILFLTFFKLKSLFHNIFILYIFLVIISLVSAIVLFVKHRKIFLNKYGFSSIRKDSFQYDKLKIKNFLIDNDLYNMEKIKVLIENINYNYSNNIKKEKEITMGFILTNIISTGFFIVNYRDLYNTINYIEALKNALIIYICTGIIYISIKIIISNVNFIKELYIDLTNKNTDYKRLINILNDILLTEDVGNTIITNIKNRLLSKIKSISCNNSN